jgi:hypothetical protein
VKSSQALAKALQGLDAAALRQRRQVALLIKSGCKPDTVLEHIHRDDLNTGRGRVGPSNQKSEAVGAQVNGGEEKRVEEVGHRF